MHIKAIRSIASVEQSHTLHIVVPRPKNRLNSFDRNSVVEAGIATAVDTEAEDSSVVVVVELLVC